MAGISSLTIGQSLRSSTMRMQTELARSQRELQGRVADLGLTLGARTKESVSLNRDVARIEGMVDTNALVALRLTATQGSLGQLGKSAQNLVGTLATSQGTGTDPSILRGTAADVVATLTAVLNTAVNDEYVFGGVNTGVAPINAWVAADSPARLAFNDAFTAYFGFGKDDPQAAAIDEPGMAAFLDSVEDQFLGGGWRQNWSNSTDEGIESRIALNETAVTSIGANDISIRKLAMAAAIVSELFSGNVGDSGRKAVVAKSTDLASSVVGGLAGIQARTGLMEQRVSNASERLETQSEVLGKRVDALESVDPYEASTRVTSLLQQIETSFALTARIQELSLFKYVG